MAIFKFQKIDTLKLLIRTLNHMFQNLDSKNIKNLDLEETNIITSRKNIEIFDDFLYQVINENDTHWVLNSGTDVQAIDPAITLLEENGVIRNTSGNASGAIAADGSQLVMSIPVQANRGNLIFETKLKINTAITQISVNAGITDTTALEEPFSGSADVLTSHASNAACFVFDDDNTTKEWFAASVNDNVDDTDNASVETAPVADTWQTLKIKVSNDGSLIEFYIDNVLVKTLNNGGINPNIDLYATVVICSTTTVSKTVDIDYVYISYNR